MDIRQYRQHPRQHHSINITNRRRRRQCMHCRFAGARDFRTEHFDRQSMDSSDEEVNDREKAMS